MKNIKIKFNEFTLFFLVSALLCGYIKNTLIILFIVLTHELGHILMAKFLGYSIISVEIFPFGGYTKIDKPLNTSTRHDLLIAIAGVLMQILIILLCKCNLIKDPLVLKYNISILLFNLLPIIPLDGSKIVFELLNFFMSYKKALKGYVIISLVSIIFYVGFNYHYMLNNYLIIILFIYKTFKIIQNLALIHHKFILERLLYNFDYAKVKNQNMPINKYQKDVKYYYYLNHQIVDQTNYLRKIYKLGN